MAVWMKGGVATSPDTLRPVVREVDFFESQPTPSLTQGVETSNTEPPIHARFTYRGDVTPQINLT